MLPLIRVMPPIYTWRMRARVYRWYDELEQAEALLAIRPAPPISAAVSAILLILFIVVFSLFVLRVGQKQY